MTANRLTNLPSKRRAFLQKSCLTAAGSVALGAAAGQALAASEQTAPSAPKQPQAKGYRLTRHVLDYYKTAAL